MKALTIKQPWAWAIAHSTKRIENRTWFSNRIVGKELAIHAGAGVDTAGYYILSQMGIEPPSRKIIDASAIVAVVTVARFTFPEDVLDPAQTDKRLGDWYADGKIGWVLADVRVLQTPVACAGMRGLWSLSPNVAQAVRESQWRPGVVELDDVGVRAYAA